MAEMKATVQVANELGLGSKGLVISITEDNNILGHLMIGSANVVWFNKNGKKKGYKCSWRELEQLIKTERKEVPATRP